MAIKFQCAYCPEEFPNFKLLVEHYEEKHEGKLKRFKIVNKRLKQSALYPASKPEEVIKCLGWDEKDCIVREIKGNSIEP